MRLMILSISSILSILFPLLLPLDHFPCCRVSGNGCAAAFSSGKTPIGVVTLDYTHSENGPAVPATAAPIYGCKVVAKYPHLTSSYTEGFFFLDGLFYEGTGLEGKSKLLVYQPDGKVLQHYDVPAQYFGEGIVPWGNNLLEWTWQSHTGFVFDRASLRPTGQSFHYTGEGWGMTRNDRELVTSDGTPILRFRSPDTFDETHQITVRDGMTPVRNLNELEWVKGEIYANVWHSDRIARISPADGHVIAWIDCTGLLPDSARIDAESVLNGIAWDAKRDRLFVTGKQWPTIFEIRPTPPR